MQQAIESRATRQITERRRRVLTSNSQDVLVPSTFSYASYSEIVAYGEHAFEKYDPRWDPMRISIPGNINDRVSIGTRNKSNRACSSRQWSCASCIHLQSFVRLPPSVHSVAILFHLFYFHFLQYIFVNSSGAALSIERELTHLRNRDISEGFYETESLSRATAEKSQNILSDFALTPRSIQEFFAGACGYFARAIGIL